MSLKIFSDLANTTSILLQYWLTWLFVNSLSGFKLSGDLSWSRISFPYLHFLQMLPSFRHVQWRAPGRLYPQSTGGKSKVESWLQWPTLSRSGLYQTNFPPSKQPNKGIVPPFQGVENWIIAAQINFALRFEYPSPVSESLRTKMWIPYIVHCCIGCHTGLTKRLTSQLPITLLMP